MENNVYIGYKSTLRTLASLAHVLSRGKLAILIYHRVLEFNDSYNKGEFNISDFDKHMYVLSKYYHCVSLEEAVHNMLSGDLHPRSVCITFDDGYMDNYTNAAPILYKHGLPATIFVASGFLNGGIMWNDRITESVRRTRKEELTIKSLDIYNYKLSSDSDKINLIKMVISKIKYLEPEKRLDTIDIIQGELDVDIDDLNLMMTDTQVQNLQNYNIHVGSHTVNHPILKMLPREQAKKEIINNRDYLSNILGYTPNVFAYPNGIPGKDYDDKDIDIVRKSGFDLAVTTKRGVCRNNSDVYQLPRIASWQGDVVRYSARIVKEYIFS